MIIELRAPLPVLVTALDLPKGVGTKSRKGTCVAWWMTPEDCLWLVVFDETGELVWAPMREIRLRANWSAGRRY
jgi:hypothetical protein